MSESSHESGRKNSPGDDTLTEMAILLQASACLHYALTELVADAHEKLASSPNARHGVLSSELRSHSARLGALSKIRDADQVANALRRIERQFRSAGLSTETQNLLRLMQRILLRSSLSRSIAIRRLNGAIDILSNPFPGREMLTQRERVALAQIVKGASSKAAARNLSISPRTMEFHRANILRKLGVRNVAELIYKVLGRDEI